MAATNTLASAKVFANAGLVLLKNSLVMGKLVTGEELNSFYTSEKAGAATGGTVYVKRPPEYVVRDGKVASPQDTLQGEVAVAIDKQKGVDVQFSSFEETLSVDSLLKSQSMKSAMAQLASQVDSDLMATTIEFPSWVGTPGQKIDSPADFFEAPQRLDELCVPMTDRNAVLTPADTYGIAGNLLANAGQAGNEVAKNALQKAKIPMLGNTEPYMSQTVYNLTCGTRNATAAVNGAAQNVTFANVRTNFQQSLVIDGVGAAKTIKKGEVFTIAGVYAVNPRTKSQETFLRQFVVLADAVSDGAGNATITIANPIITTGAYQNVSAAPADDAVITWLGAASASYRQNSAFHKSAIKLVSAKLIRPYTGESESATDPDTGITVRYWRYSDGTNDLHNHRYDIIYGCVNVDRRLGTRVSGTA